MTDPQKAVADEREAIDAFYWEHGPCCAGCDWWHYHNSLAGQCTRSALVASIERMALLGIEAASMSIGAGHVFTSRGHHCGDFKDGFDWSSLPLAYTKRVGAPASSRLEG